MVFLALAMSPRDEKTSWGWLITAQPANRSLLPNGRVASPQCGRYVPGSIAFLSCSVKI
jgi:hypothetical protein